MARLFRPHVPLSIKVKVAERQCAAKPNEGWRFYQATGWHPNMHFGKRIKILLEVLAQQFGCAVADLRLDHNPPLGARPQERSGLGRTRYIPDANSADHLFYRPHGMQFDGSHDRKTRIAGDHGQYSDIALVKRERRRQRRENPTPAQKKLAAMKQKQRETAKKLRRKIKLSERRKQ